MKFLALAATTVLALMSVVGLLSILDSAAPLPVMAATNLPLTTCSQGPTNPPASATNNLDRYAADWGVYCELTPTWALTNVTTPSLDGEALQCALTGGAPYSNVHCYRNLLWQPGTLFTLTLSFQFTPTTTYNHVGGPSIVQALEFSMSKWHQGQRYEFALQWQNVGSGAPQWRYWDPSQPDPNKWLPLNPPLPEQL